MKCDNCGEELQEGLLFCTNCGAAIAEQVKAAEFDPFQESAPDAGAAWQTPSGELGASLESAVQANDQAISEIESHEPLQQEAAARWAEAEAQAADYSAQGAFQSASGAPEAPIGYQPPVQAAPVAAPFYQQDASPNAHYSSQRSYEQDAYGAQAAPGDYRSPSYGQQAAGWATGQAAPNQVGASQPVTHRAFAMTLYVSGLIGLIFGLCVRDKDDAFITHHLNNVAVIFIGGIVAGMLTAVLIGFILGIYLIVMAVMGIVSAYHGEMTELPLIGKIHIVK